MSSLKENVSSDYFKAYAGLLPKSQPKPVVVYVESDADIVFWHKILQPYETSKIRFEIKLPSNTSLTKNKQQALSHSNEILGLQEVGEFLLICVDSDYDYLLCRHYQTEYKQAIAKKINDSPYIFQTYAYAIENLNCFAGSLHSICVSATYNDAISIDFEAFLSQFSKIVYELFLWNLFFYSKGQDDKFTLEAFCSIIEIKDTENCTQEEVVVFADRLLENLKIKVNKKLEELECNFSEDIDNISDLGKKLEELGLTHETAYLYIRGHTLFDNVVLMLLKQICKMLIKEKEDLIKTLAKHEKDFITNRNAYAKKVGKINARLPDLLSNNMEFKNCFLYKKIQADIESYLA